MTLGDVTRTGCAEWGDAHARPSVVVWLSICGFHGGGARGRLSVDAERECRMMSGMIVYVGVE